MKTAPADGMSVSGIDFRYAVTALIHDRKPRSIIETGTYLGLGTTKILAEALDKDYQCFTIESNPFSYAIACQNLREYHGIRLLNGYSVPEKLMPTREGLIQWLDELDSLDIYVDFQEHERIDCYMREAGHNVPYDMLGVCMRYFRPDLVVLDSAGHMGFIEFCYVRSMLVRPCLFVLDDTNHVKHHQSLLWIKSDPHFTLLKESDEKFGFCIAAWSPL
jgi:Predicted O-methyltransferase